MTGFDSKRQAAQDKMNDDSDTLLLVYQSGFADGKAAKRQWVGLTPEEILDMFDINNVYGSKWIEFARSVETKLKAKNDH